MHDPLERIGLWTLVSPPLCMYHEKGTGGIESSRRFSLPYHDHPKLDLSLFSFRLEFEHKMSAIAL
jgi:hypothetical protein